MHLFRLELAVIKICDRAPFLQHKRPFHFCDERLGLEGLLAFTHLMIRDPSVRGYF